MGKRTPLYDTHVASGAKIVDFGGWDMPVAYGSQIEEHHAVRRDAGMFDVSHMCPVDVEGADARAFLKRLVANNVDKLTQSGKALYACMLNDGGGVIDDLIIYFLRDDWFRVVVNASTADKDLAWMEKVRLDGGFNVDDQAAARPGDDRRAGAECAREVLAGAARDESRDRRPGTVFRGRSGRTLRRAHRLHRRRRLRGHAAGRAGAEAVDRPESGGCRRSRTRRARHAAARGRHESVRQRHGRGGLAARCRPRVDGRPEVAARLRRPRGTRAAVGQRGRAQGAGRASSCSTRACCARTRRS